MKLLITGAKGQLGDELIRSLDGKHEIVGIDIDELDITDGKAVEKFVKNEKPDIVINPAAYTNVDNAEANANAAYKVNAVGAQNMASACLETGAKLVHFSTDFIFDGEKNGEYDEFDIPNPISVYGRSKLAGEVLVREILPMHFIIRTAWLYGVKGSNFVRTMLKLSETHDEVKVVNDQFGNPTYAKDLALTVERLIGTNAFGTYHCTNRGIVSRYDFVKRIFELAGKRTQVIPVTTEELGRPARRPKNSALRNMMLELTIGDKMRNWDEALVDFMTKIGALKGDAH